MHAIGHEADDLPDLTFDLDEVSISDFIAVRVSKRIYVAKVIKVFYASRMFQAALWEVGVNERFGPWNRRKWVPYVDVGGSPQIDLFPEVDVVAKVSLQDGALTDASLEKIQLLNVPVGEQPTRDKSLPGMLA